MVPFILKQHTPVCFYGLYASAFNSGVLYIWKHIMDGNDLPSVITLQLHLIAEDTEYFRQINSLGPGAWCGDLVGFFTLLLRYLSLFT